MPFSFECGTCHALYRLDDDQITAGGVKVTCPKCMSFFYFKRGAGQEERPLVEHIVEDGPQEVQIPPPADGEMTTDQLLSDEDIDLPQLGKTPPPKAPEKKVQARAPEKRSPGRYSYMPQKATQKAQTKAPPSPSVKVTKDAIEKEGESEPPVRIPPSLREVTGSRRLTRQAVTKGPAKVQHGELIELPSDEYTPGKFEKMMVPIFAGIIVIGLLILFNVMGFYRIPFFQKSEPDPSQTKPVTPDESEDSDQPKYGFPKMDTRDAQ